jgi:hypothetical protein
VKRGAKFGLASPSAGGLLTGATLRIAILTRIFNTHLAKGVCRDEFSAWAQWLPSSEFRRGG